MRRNHTTQFSPTPASSISGQAHAGPQKERTADGLGNGQGVFKVASSATSGRGWTWATAAKSMISGFVDKRLEKDFHQYATEEAGRLALGWCLFSMLNLIVMLGKSFLNQNVKTDDLHVYMVNLILSTFGALLVLTKYHKHSHLLQLWSISMRGIRMGMLIQWGMVSVLVMHYQCSDAHDHTIFGNPNHCTSRILEQHTHFNICHHRVACTPALCIITRFCQAIVQ